jgi:putative ABC transport system substrate-binding protein
MRRRAFVKLLAASALLPSAGWTQTSGTFRRIGVLGPLPPGDPVEQRRMAAFREGLQAAGLSEGRNVRIEYRSNIGGPEELRQQVEGLVAEKPDAILVTSSGLLAALSKATRDLPIVFVNVADPVGLGLVTNMARPGGNITGFTPLDFMAGAAERAETDDYAGRRYSRGEPGRQRVLRRDSVGCACAFD